ncbi:hemerythrin domain-containing protein [Mycolicibacterium sp. P1-5]|uniref:hemerythrin domain-containing protein n=1 Tax=Mycolicibacterium sp. P1-5 TaxID=2024617 RepID=UPI0011EE80A7|nr:hemerythrin domain-containing protein [Mycolicibacterium sp. P1-5]KAA0107929.1 hemerythrin domain-containing protein [Mycolicibacterium sp. P1-5]
MPLLRDYIAEHERAIDHGGSVVRALDEADYGRAHESLSAMAEELRAHWSGEENGLFAVMATDELFASHITPLVREHRELDELLATADLTDGGDRKLIREAIFELREHIVKEEDGLFPASLTALDGEQWDAAITGWHQAHPGKSPLGGS